MHHKQQNSAVMDLTYLSKGIGSDGHSYKDCTRRVYVKEIGSDGEDMVHKGQGSTWSDPTNDGSETHPVDYHRRLLDKKALVEYTSWVAKINARFLDDGVGDSPQNKI